MAAAWAITEGETPDRAACSGHQPAVFGDWYVFALRATRLVCWQRFFLPAMATCRLLCSRRCVVCCSSSIVPVGGWSNESKGEDCAVGDLFYNCAEGIWQELEEVKVNITSRAGCTVVNTGHESYVFGGEDDTGALLDDLHVLTLSAGVVRSKRVRGAWLIGLAPQ